MRRLRCMVMISVLALACRSGMAGSSKRILLFLKKKKQKDFYSLRRPRFLRPIPPPSCRQEIKVFWFFFFRKEHLLPKGQSHAQAFAIRLRSGRCLICGSAAAQEQSFAVNGGIFVTPSSSIERSADAGQRAHTNVHIFYPGGVREAAVKPNGPYETPGSLACIYGRGKVAALQPRLGDSAADRWQQGGCSGGCL